jgi:Uma2 family endonuclease
MSTVAGRSLTAEDFGDWIHRPENQDRQWELDAGEVVEMPSPGELHGGVCAWLAALLWRHVGQRGRGYVCSNDTGLVVKRDPDTVRGPDLMLFDEPRKLDQLSRQFVTSLPRLIVEVLSPTDQTGRVNRRIAQYLQRDVPLVWLVDPECRIVTVYRPDQAMQTLDETEELAGGEALPDFRCPVAEIFNPPGQ